MLCHLLFSTCSETQAIEPLTKWYTVVHIEAAEELQDSQALQLSVFLFGIFMALSIHCIHVHEYFLVTIEDIDKDLVTNLRWLHK